MRIKISFHSASMDVVLYKWDRMVIYSRSSLIKRRKRSRIILGQGVRMDSASVRVPRGYKHPLFHLVNVSLDGQCS